MGFRLHIDIPLGTDEEKAILDAIKISAPLADIIKMQNKNIATVQYRLGHDEDRQKSNYLIKTDSGHVTCKKCKIKLS